MVRSKQFCICFVTYKLADFILENHDWDSELQIFETTMQSAFGNNWESMVSQIISWRGLENTNEFNNWATQNNIEYHFAPDGSIAGEFGGYISLIKEFGNKNCN